MVTDTDPTTAVDLSRLPARLKRLGVEEILQSCIQHETSTEITLLRLIFASRDAAHLESLMQLVGEFAKSSNQSTLQEICSLYEENREGCARIMSLPEPKPLTKSMTPGARIERLRESFDKWVEEDPGFSVALYTFGNPRLLHKTSEEVVNVLDDWGVLGSAVDALQIGCGAGRIEALLCQKVHLACGIDISANMIRAARQQAGNLENVRFHECSGRDLALFEANSFDLVYAVDSFPYIVEVGEALVDCHFAEVARVLRDGGHFVILQYSYRDDAARDLDDVRQKAAAYGYAIVREAVTPFKIWDGVGYHLRKKAS